MTDRVEEIRTRWEAATWRAIPTADGYSAGSDGTIRSELNWRGSGTRRLTSTLTKDGYLRVRLSIKGERVNRTVHRLVAEAFSGPRPPHGQVRHLDGDKTNNRPENLAWGSALENADDRERHGRTARGERNGAHTTPDARPRGETQGQAKLTDESVRALRVSYASEESVSALARRHGVSRKAIRDVLDGKAWTHVV